MKNLNLTSLNLQEMNTEEMNDVYGGGKWSSLWKLSKRVSIDLAAEYVITKAAEWAKGIYNAEPIGSDGSYASQSHGM